MDNAIEVRELNWRPGKGFAIQELDVSVPRGAIYGFLGPNGSGKTSTIRLLMGMARPDDGEIRILDRTVPGELPEILARTGYVPERPHLYTGLTVAEVIRFHSAFFPDWDGRWGEELRGSFRLDPDARIGTMSKGEVGKLMILLALAQLPELLVLDEPTDGLDPVVRRDVMAAVVDYVSETRATVFISSHLIHELERFCDWVGVVEDGRMLAEMPMEIFKNEIKRIRVVDPPPEPPPEIPFVVLGRQPSDGLSAGETWIVQGWEDTMAGFLTGTGASVREVVHLDLEEGFVELLRAARPELWRSRNGSWDDALLEPQMPAFAERGED